MARVHPDGISDHLRDWIARQPLFFVATADGYAEYQRTKTVLSLDGLPAVDRY